MLARAGIQSYADKMETRHESHPLVLASAAHALSMRCLDFVYSATRHTRLSQILAIEKTSLSTGLSRFQGVSLGITLAFQNLLTSEIPWRYPTPKSRQIYRHDVFFQS